MHHIPQEGGGVVAARYLVLEDPLAGMPGEPRYPQGHPFFSPGELVKDLVGKGNLLPHPGEVQYPVPAHSINPPVGL